MVGGTRISNNNVCSLPRKRRPHPDGRRRRYLYCCRCCCHNVTHVMAMMVMITMMLLMGRGTSAASTLDGTSRNKLGSIFLANPLDTTATTTTTIQSRTCSILRGGGAGNDDEDSEEEEDEEEAAELDAYIESLLNDFNDGDEKASKGSTSDNQKPVSQSPAVAPLQSIPKHSAVKTTTQATSTKRSELPKKSSASAVVKKSSGAPALTGDKDKVKGETTASSSSRRETTKTPVDSSTKKTTTTTTTTTGPRKLSKQRNSKKLGSSSSSSSSKKQQKNATLASSTKKTQPIKEKAQSSPAAAATTAKENMTTNTTTTVQESNATSNITTEEGPNSKNSPAPPERRRPPPPNRFYRFLLRRAGGFGGRSTVLLLVTTSEFLHTYFPPIAKAGDWMLTKIFPSQEPGSRRHRRGGAPPPPTSSLNVASVSRMARTGVSRKKRRQFTKQADQQALAQLKQRPASELRYTFCSPAFIKRHGLGKWASAPTTAAIQRGTENFPYGATSEVVAREKDDPLVQEAEESNNAAAKKKKKPDWVLSALTKEPRHKRAPTLTLDVGSGGLTIGVELDWSGQKERVKAALQLPAQRSKSSPPTTSASSAPATSSRRNDADGGVVGRLKAAAGSSMARSLSGAYPGDALAVDEAGNSYGLADFSAKYGYGDWSEENEDSDDQVFSKRRRRRKSNRGQDKDKNFWEDIGVSFSTSSSSVPRRRRSPTSDTPRSDSKASPSVSRISQELPSTRNMVSPSFSSLRDKARSRPSQLSRKSEETQQKTVPKRQVELTHRPMSRIEELKKKNRKESGDD